MFSLRKVYCKFPFKVVLVFSCKQERDKRLVSFKIDVLLHKRAWSYSVAVSAFGNQIYEYPTSYFTLALSLTHKSVVWIVNRRDSEALQVAPAFHWSSPISVCYVTAQASAWINTTITQISPLVINTHTETYSHICMRSKIQILKMKMLKLLAMAYFSPEWCNMPWFHERRKGVEKCWKFNIT